MRATKAERLKSQEVLRLEEMLRKRQAKVADAERKLADARARADRAAA